MPLRVVVLASGTGTLLHSLIQLLDPENVAIVAVGADKECPAIAKATDAGLPTFVVPFDDAARADRAGWNRRLLAAVRDHAPDVVVSAGFMRILGEEFVAAYADRIINTHPALLPSFPGAHAVEDALAHGVKVTGTTVHIVDNGVDTGPILAQHAVPVADDDDRDSLHEKIKQVERRLLADVLTTIATRGYTRDGRKAKLQ
nr:phosphoribosylglycinamide formyltransferase [Corynebacterium sp. TAE3-ERU12]